MKGEGNKNSWALFLLIFAGIVLGGFLSLLAQDSGSFSWLNYGQTFGMDSPIVVNLGIIVVSFSVSVRITMASIIGIILAVIVYRVL